MITRGGSNKNHGVESLAGKVAIITGGNTGIGKVCAEELAKLGCKVILACRNQARGEGAVRDIVQTLQLKDASQVSFLQLDLSSFESVRAFVAQFRALQLPLHILLNNAGVMMCPFATTAEGIEMQFGTNHMGHFLLTTSLMEEIRAGSARVVNLSSLAHATTNNGMADLDAMSSASTYDPAVAYGVSKLANLLFTMELQQRLQGSGAAAYAVHPGVVRTELARHMPAPVQMLVNSVGGLLMKSPLEGAQTSLFCCLNPQAQPGKYHAECGATAVSPIVAKYPNAPAELWALSEKLVAEHS